MTVLAPSDADRLAELARAAAPLVARAVRATGRGDGAVAHAGRLVEHWRREAAVLPAAAGLGGRLTAGAQEQVAAAVQAALVLGLCELDGVTDLRRRVEVLARACLNSEVPRQWSPPRLPAPPPDERRARARLVELGRDLRALGAAGTRRPGRPWQQALSGVPLVGAAAVLLAERHALREVAAAALAELGLAMPDPGESWG